MYSRHHQFNCPSDCACFQLSYILVCTAVSEFAYLIRFHRNFDGYNGSSNLDNHFAQFNASRYIQTDGILIPNGTIANTLGTPLDFSTAKSLGAAINETAGMDLCGTGQRDILSSRDEL
jgi:hypothetical protein